MSIKLMSEHHLEFLSLKGGCTGSSESTLVKIPHCWKSHVAAQLSSPVCPTGICACVVHVEATWRSDQILTWTPCNGFPYFRFCVYNTAFFVSSEEKKFSGIIRLSSILDPDVA